MKKLIVLIALLISVGGYTQEASATTSLNADSHVIFYIPHQDDDLLTMGVGIRAHLNGGHDVHVVMLTDGSASVIRTRLGMTKEAFTTARNKEFALAMKTLGVNENNIDYRSFEDGNLSVNQVKSVIREYETRYPNAKHKTYSDTDWHVDHKNSGIALRQLLNAGEVTDARFYVRDGTATPVGIPLLTETFYTVDKPIMLAASKAYTQSIPWMGYYGIGYLSVPKSFDAFNKLPQSRYHK